MSAGNWVYPRIIAHRCGGALAPENTLAGLDVAARLGIRAVEFDVMLSADGAPLVIHDETLERTTDGRGQVALHTSAELQALDAGLRHHRAYAGERIPTLGAALARCRALGLAVNVEIKPATGHEAATGRAVAEAVRAFQTGCVAAGREPLPVLMSSFSEAALDAARLAASDDGAPARALLFETVPGDWRARMRQLDCQTLHCAAAALSPGLLEELRAARVGVACYTVNCPDAAARLFADGVAAIFTDRLDLFAFSGERWR